jgi:RNA polymerase sigma-70 factor (ECF subfamily)
MPQLELAGDRRLHWVQFPYRGFLPWRQPTRRRTISQHIRGNRSFSTGRVKTMNDPDPLPSASFPTTLWTVVLYAGQARPAQAHAALAQLCQDYWYPLYSFVRHRGYSPHDSQDLTQAFFAQLLEKRALGCVDPEQGRFRTFLLAALKNFLANDWDRSQARKRGGGATILSLDDLTGESRFRLEPSCNLTPERHFERQWAVTLLDQVLAALRVEYHSGGNGELFEELKTVLAVGQPDSYAAMAARLKRSEGAIKVAVHRLRRRYRDLLRQRIAETVVDGEVEDEVRHLLAVFAE